MFLNHYFCRRPFNFSLLLDWQLRAMWRHFRHTPSSQTRFDPTCAQLVVKIVNLARSASEGQLKLVSLINLLYLVVFRITTEQRCVTLLVGGTFPGGEGEGSSYVKGVGMLVGKFESKPSRRPIWAWPKHYLTWHLKDTILKQTDK